MPGETAGRLSGHRRGNFVEMPAGDSRAGEPTAFMTNSKDFLHSQAAVVLSFFGAVGVPEAFPLYSSNFILIFAFQGGIVHHFPDSSLVLPFTF
jgi:hypothetical protein